MKFFEPTIIIPRNPINRFNKFIKKYIVVFLIIILTTIAITSFVAYYKNGLGLAYNDARSHLDIGRRVVEGLKPGLAQIGSVWLPLPHLLMVPTIWNDFMWHSGLSGALQSMISFVLTAILVYFYLKALGVKLVGRLVGVAVFVANINILYLQSTAMTELLLMATTLAGSYFLLIWSKNDKIINLILAAFFIMLSTLNRYDGWFLFLMSGGLIALISFIKKGYKKAEGASILFATLAGVGIFLWFIWNALIFKDPLYFAFGPFSAHAQQAQLSDAGVLQTKGNIVLSVKVYLYALLYNSYTFPAILAAIGSIILVLNKKINFSEKAMTMTLFSPLIFNIIALYLGHSVLFVQGISGNTWFNVRYGVLLMPSIAIFVGFLVNHLKKTGYIMIALLCFMMYFAFANSDAVTIDDAKVGSSQKNVSEVSGWLKTNAKDKDGFILISAASHDAIIFSSDLPMKKFIHEGTGPYWLSATAASDRWARWIIMRTYDANDLTYREVSKTDALSKYNLVGKYPFADIYELKDEYLKELNTKPILNE